MAADHFSALLSSYLGRVTFHLDNRQQRARWTLAGSFVSRIKITNFFLLSCNSCVVMLHNGVHVTLFSFFLSPAMFLFLFLLNFLFDAVVGKQRKRKRSNVSIARESLWCNMLIIVFTFGKLAFKSEDLFESSQSPCYSTASRIKIHCRSEIVFDIRWGDWECFWVRIFGMISTKAFCHLNLSSVTLYFSVL